MTGTRKTVPDPPPYDRRRPQPTMELAFQNRLPNCPGKSSVGLIVSFPPNSSTPPHRHAGTSVSALVLEGTMLHKMNNDPAFVVGPGDTFFEAPGCHHRVSDNYSATKPAKLLATYVVDTEIVEKGGIEALVETDEEYK